MPKLKLREKSNATQYNYSQGGTKKERDAFDWLNRCITEASIWCEPDHKRHEENERYAIGFQWSEGDAQRQAEKERPALPLNKIRKVLDAVANREIMDRFVPKVYGRESADDGVAEVLDELMRWQRDESHTEHHESAAFRKNCMSGYGVMHKWWNEAAFDGLGSVADEEIPLWMMLWDPRARQQNLSDRKYQISGKYVPTKEIKNAYTGRGIKKRLDALAQGGRATDSGGVSATGTRWGWRDVVSGDRWYLRAQDECFVVEFEWLDHDNVYKVPVPIRMEEMSEFLSNPEGQLPVGSDPETGEPIFISTQQWSEMSPEDKAMTAYGVLQETDIQVFEKKSDADLVLDFYFNLTGQELPFKKRPRQRVKYMISTRDIILEEGVRPFGFTYEFMTGVPFEQRDGMRFRGMVDFAKGPQDMYNVLNSNLLATYMTSPKDSLMIEESLVANPQQFTNAFAKLGGVQFVPDGMVQQWDQRVKTLTSHNPPPMLENLITITASAVEEMFGLSSIEMGAQGDLRRVSGTVAGQSRQASNTILALWFDSLRQYRKRWGILNLKFLQEAYSPREMLEIVGADVGAGLTGMEKWPDVNRFSIKIDESPTSITEQMEMSNLLISSGTLQKLVDSGQIMPEDSIDLMFAFPKSLRERIKANMGTMKKLQEQMQQMQQQVQEGEQKYQLLMEFLLTIDRGGEIKQAFETTYMLGQQMAQKMMEAQQQQQQGAMQPPAN